MPYPQQVVRQHWYETQFRERRVHGFTHFSCDRETRDDDLVASFMDARTGRTRVVVLSAQVANQPNAWDHVLALLPRLPPVTLADGVWRYLDAKVERMMYP